MQLDHYVAILWRRCGIIALCGVVATVAGFWFTSQQTPVYESEARYLVGPALSNADVTINDLRASSQVGQTYAELATSRPLMQAALDKLNLDMNVRTLSGKVTATWVDTKQILIIGARADDPDTAAALANTIGEELVARSPGGPTTQQATRREQAIAEITRLEQTIHSTELMLEQLGNEINHTSDDVVLRGLIIQYEYLRDKLEQAQEAVAGQLTLVQNRSTNQITVVESAVAASRPISPNLVPSLLAALFAGLVFGLAGIAVYEYFNDAIYTTGALRATTGLAYLGAISQFRKSPGPGITQLVVHSGGNTQAVDDFHLLRVQVQELQRERQVRSLMITSVSRGDGKTEIAANLAVALAKSGMQVILIDADLRRPRLATLFELPDHAGLSSLLDPTKDLPQPRVIEGISGLLVLPAGEPMSNPTELLGSPQMEQFVRQAESHADVVIVDVPPLSMADPLVLAPHVDGVLLVTSFGRSSRARLAEGASRLHSVGARLLGAVLNGVGVRESYRNRDRTTAMRQSREPAGERTGFAPALNWHSNRMHDDHSGEASSTIRERLARLATSNTTGEE